MRDPSSYHNDTRPGPWGTSRAAERRYGYPPPRPLSPSARLELRLAEAERRIESIEALALILRERGMTAQRKSAAELEYEAARAARAARQTAPRGSYTHDRINRVVTAHNRNVKTVGDRMRGHADRLGTVEQAALRALRDIETLSAELEVLLAMLDTAGVIDRESLRAAAELLVVLRQGPVELPEDGEEWAIRDGRVVVTDALPAIHDVQDHYTDGRDAPLDSCSGCSSGHIHWDGPFEARDTDDPSVPPPCCRAARSRLA